MRSASNALVARAPSARLARAAGRLPLVVASTLSLVLLASALPAQAAAPETRRPGRDGWDARQIRKGVTLARDRELLDRLPGRARVGYHPETRRVRFLSGTPNAPLTSGVAAVTSGRRSLSTADARSKARGFVDRYGELFGLRDPGRELRVRSTRRPSSATDPRAARSRPGGRAAGSGGSMAGPRGASVRFGQVRDGVPVMGGEIVVQLSADGEVVSAAGEVLPSAAPVRRTARIPVARARTTAAAWLAREASRPRSAVRVRSEGLALYDPRLMGDPFLEAAGTRLVWRLDARLPASRRQAGDHRLILVDATGGQVLTSIGRIYDAARRVCDNRNAPGRSYRCNPPFARSEGQPAVGIRDVDKVYRLMGVVDDWFATRFGRNGIDDKGSRMKATVRYCPSAGCPWRNAEWHWADQQAVFGRGWAKADDIVAHEFMHGVLDHESPFFYLYQSGAINEHFADVFGELVDLSHSGGTDTAFTRWKIGEDTPIGAFRDMKNPRRFGHPDRVRSPLWHTGKSDFGGVHRNNGVGNKAAYLIADGGTFRGFSIAGIGLNRTARVYYQALTTRLTSAANYIDLADALVAACTDLLGSGITAAHCKSVRKATRATQMHLRPKKLAPKTAPLCGSGKRPVNVLFDDFEDPDRGLWRRQRLAGKRRGWYYPQNPNNQPGWDATWSSSGRLNLYAPNRSSRSDTVMKLRQARQLPAGAKLRFEHGFVFDKDARRRYDGGVVEIKLDGGRWRGVNSLFTHGGYNGRIARNHGNPIGGRRAFTGDSHGWAAARVDLSAFAGRSMKVRFRMASDRSVGGLGWYIDDVRIYVCADDSDRPTGSLTIDAGAATTTDGDVELAITAQDPTTWVTRLRLSNSNAVNASGLLKNALTMPFRNAVDWDITAAAYGGNGNPGVKHVSAQVKDAAGNWSAVFNDSIELLDSP